MDNNKKLFEELLKADGIDPAEVSESERAVFKEMLDSEQKRFNRLRWLFIGIDLILLLTVIVLNFSENLLEKLHIPFTVPVFALVIAWAITMKYWPSHETTIEEGSKKISKLHYLVHGKHRGFDFVSRKDGKRIIHWFRLLIFTVVIWVLLALGGAGVYYLLCQRWIYSSIYSLPLWLHILCSTLLPLGFLIDTLRTGLKAPLDELVEVKQKSKQSKPGSQPDIWRIIMKTKTAKFAMAAMIIIAVLVGINQFGESIDVTGVAFAKITEATKKIQWMHAITEETERNIASGVTAYHTCYESWTSLNPFREIKVSSDGTIYFNGDSSGRFVNAQYDPMIKTVTFRFPKATDNVCDDLPENYRHLFLKMFDELEKQGAKVEYAKDTYEDREVWIINFDYSSEDGIHLTGNLVVDLETYLPMKFLHKTVIDDQVERTVSSIIDYPSVGPIDIFEAGAPVDAKTNVIDDEPQVAFNQAVEIYQTARENIPNRYVLAAIFIEKPDAVQKVTVIQKDAHRKRIQNYSIFQQSALPEISASLESVLDWNDRIENKSYNIRIDDEKYSYGAYPGAKGTWSVRKWRLGSIIHVNAFDHIEDLADLGWPKIVVGPTECTDPQFRYKLIQNDFSTSNNLLCFERYGRGYSDGKIHILPSRSLYYIDPQRDYICVRQEFFQHKSPSHMPIDTDELDTDPGSTPNEPSSVIEVVEFHHTPTNQWFPKKIMKSDLNTVHGNQSVLVYLDSDPDFSEKVFDIENLPK